MAVTFCTRCGKPLAIGSAVCAGCGTPVAPAGRGPVGPVAATPPPPSRTCAHCRTAMRWTGHFNLRTMGFSGPGGYPTADPSAAETVLPFSLYYCQTCGKFDFYYPGT